MKAEIIAVGTELLLGQVVNSNATYLSQELAALGIEVYYHTAVGDNPARLTELLTLAQKRSELIVLCGGLGPTEDDLTREVVADFVGEQVVFDESTYQEIQAKFSRQGRAFPENNRRQAYYIEHGQKIANPNGLALGSFYSASDGTHYLLLPGPPNELKPMMRQEVRPLLREEIGEVEVLESRVLRFFGIGESQLVTQLADLIAQQTNPTVAPYAKTGEVTLRLTAKARETHVANELLNRIEEQIQLRVGEYFYGYGDGNSLPRTVIETLAEQGKTIALAESLTAGMASSMLGDTPGASRVLVGGFITYTNELKEQLLGIPTAVLANEGAVSAVCAEKMAQAVREQCQADIGLAFTGVAGPDRIEDKEVGTVFIGIATAETSEVLALRLQGNREKIRYQAALHGFNAVRMKMQK